VSVRSQATIGKNIPVAMLLFCGKRSIRIGRVPTLPTLAWRLGTGFGNGVDVGVRKPQMLPKKPAGYGPRGGFTPQPRRPDLQQLGGLLSSQQHRVADVAGARVAVADEAQWPMALS
jgi:hypothetical protein